jgi:hypothetical protein
MEPSSLTADQLSVRLSSHRRSGFRFFAVVLTDGSTVLAETANARLSDPTQLELAYTSEHEIRHVNIPVSEVGGTHAVNAPLPHEDAESSDEFAWGKRSFVDLLCNNAVAHASARGFDTWSIQIAQMMRLPNEDSRPDKVKYVKSELMYSDTRYLMTSGGLTGASAAGPVGGGGLSWAPNVRRKAMRRLKRKRRSIDRLCDAGQSACVSGYVEFFDLSKYPKTTRAEYEYRVDEGPPFLPALIRLARSSKSPDVALVYFRDIWGVFPLAQLEIWERLVQPVRVYGDVIHSTPPRAAWSNYGCFMLARCAGVIV